MIISHLSCCDLTLQGKTLKILRQSLLNNNTTIANSGIGGSAAFHMVRSLQVELGLTFNSAGRTCYAANTVAQWFGSYVSFFVIAYIVFHNYFKLHMTQKISHLKNTLI